MNHNLLVGQSGGPTAVINGSLYGVVSEGLANPEIDNVIGIFSYHFLHALSIRAFHHHLVFFHHGY